MDEPSILGITQRAWRIGCVKGGSGSGHRFLNISHATLKAMPLLGKAVHTELARALTAREQMAAADEPPAHWALRASRPGAMLE